MSEVQAAIPTVVVAVTDEANFEIKGAKVVVDGVAVRADQFPFELNPGEHTVSVEAAGYQPERRAVLIRQGNSIPVPIVMRSLMLDGGRATLSETPSDLRPKLALGAAVGFGAAAGALGVLGWMRYQRDLDALCGPCTEDRRNEIEAATDGRDTFRALTIGAGALALVATGLGIYFLSAKPDDSSSGTAARLGAGLLRGLGGTF